MCSDDSDVIDDTTISYVLTIWEVIDDTAVSYALTNNLFKEISSSKYLVGKKYEN